MSVKILYIDDEPGLLEIAKLYLEEGGEFAVDIEQDPIAALVRIMKDDFDIVISDYQMPEMDGLQLLERIRSDGKEIPFILFTGKGREEVVIRAFKLGADAYLQKGGDVKAQFAELMHQVRVAVAHHKDEIALEESKKKYFSMFENSPASVIIYRIIWDAQGEILDMKFDDLNQVAVQQLGRPKEMLIGMSCIDFYGMENIHESISRTRDVMSSGISQQFEMHFRWDDRHYLASYYLVDKDRIASVKIDITELRKAQENVRQSEERLRAILENTQDSVYMKDRMGRIQLANPATLDAIGKPTEEVIGRTDTDYFNDPEIGNEIFARDQHIMETGNEQVVEERVRTPDGLKTFLSAKKPLRNQTGKVVGLIGVSRDITDRKMAERERESTIEFLSLINKSNGTRDLVHSASVFFQKKSGCEAVGIRLREGDDFPYYEARGFSAEFVRLDNDLCGNAGAKLHTDRDGRPMIDCTCGDIIFGRYDISSPNFTVRGSFWTNSTTELAAVTSERKERPMGGGHCLYEGYESVALIPLFLGSERMGLLQLNDHRKGMFFKDLIFLWERLVGYLAVALAKFRAEEEALEGEKRYRSLIEQSPAAIGIGRNGLTIYGNQRYLELFRLNNADDVIGHPVIEQIAPAARERIAKLIHRQERGTTLDYDIETEGLRKNGEIFSMNVSVKKVTLNDGPALMAYFTDITARKKVEEGLRESRAQAKIAMDIAKMGIWTFDPALGQFFFDDHFYRLYGTDTVREGGFLMAPETYFHEFVHPDDLDRVAGWIQSNLGSGISEDGAVSTLMDDEKISTLVEQIEHRIIKRDGEVRNIIVRVNLEKDAGGHIVRVRGVNQDITDLRQRENDLKKANEKLNLLNSITRHDIINQLMVLKGNIVLLDDMIKEPEAKARLLKIDAAAVTITKQIQFTKIYQELGTLPPQWQRIDEVVMRSSAGKEIDKIELGGSVSTLEVYADPMLDKVFHNLLEDSVRYAGKPLKIRIDCLTTDDGLILYYEDLGPGIAAEEKEKVFEKGHGKGTGLGLFLSRGILALTDISISETGELGHGVRFEMHVPADKFRFR